MNWKADHKTFCTPYFIETFPGAFQNVVFESKGEEYTEGASFVISPPRQMLGWSYLGDGIEGLYHE